MGLRSLGFLVGDEDCHPVRDRLAARISAREALVEDMIIG